MFSKKFLKLSFSTVNHLPKRYAMKKKFCMDFYYKRNNLYNFCYNCGVLKLYPPIENCIKKSFTRTVKFHIRDSSNKENDIATYIHEIAALMNCSEAEIEKSFKEHPSLLTNLDLESTSMKLSLLLEKFDKAEILKNIWILEFPYDELENRLNEMTKWELDDDILCKLLPLLKIPSLDFYRMSAKFIVEKNTSKEKNRIIFIAKEMQCPIEQVVEHFLQYQSLLFRSFRQIKDDIKILKEFNITGEELLQDISILTIAPSKLKKRLEKLVNLDMKKHLYLIHASEKSFDNKIQNAIEKISIMENWSSAEEYISQKLNLSPEEIADIKVANPKVFKMNIVKLKHVLEFLLSCGYTTKQISLFPTVFNYNILRLQERYAELKSFGITLPKIAVLCVNQKYYDSLLERLKTRAPKKISQKEDSVAEGTHLPENKKPSQ